VTIRDMWRRITSTRRTRALEAEITRQRAEIDRLRAENRALLNSILGIAGIPPIPVTASDPVITDTPGHAFKRATSQPANATASAAEASGAKARDAAMRVSARLKPCPDVSIPLRRPSWHQISRMFEFESARKRESGDGA
jgi:hypothetical protein